MILTFQENLQIYYKKDKGICLLFTSFKHNNNLVGTPQKFFTKTYFRIDKQCLKNINVLVYI